LQEEYVTLLSQQLASQRAYYNTQIQRLQEDLNHAVREARCKAAVLVRHALPRPWA
jgi:hypothetical protein